MDWTNRLVESNKFSAAIIFLILLNALTIGLETYPSIYASHGYWLDLIDYVILRIFTLEIALRFIAARPKSHFFRDGWQWFDVLVVTAGHLPDSEFLMVFRLMRILRVLRTFTLMPGLQRIVDAILRSMPSLAHILVILGMLFYVYGTAGTFLYGEIAPQRFGTLDRSFLTLFQIITLESWTAVMFSVEAQAPWCWLYFISFILVGTFFALNSVIGILVSNMEDVHEEGELKQILSALRRIEDRLSGK